MYKAPRARTPIVRIVFVAWLESVLTGKNFVPYTTKFQL